MGKFILTILVMAVTMVARGQDTTRLSLLFLGDVMQHDSQIADTYDRNTGRYDYHPCFRLIKPYIEAVDLAIGNLEVTLAGKPYKGYPQFSAPDELLTALKDLGLDVMVTANNHCVDRGSAGLVRTIDMLDSVDILHTGTFRSQKEKEKLNPLIIERQGFRLALLNYTYGTNGLPVKPPVVVNMLDTAAIRKDLIKAKAKSPDAIIVFTHCGIEYESLPSKTQKDIAELCFKEGARLVIGSHPHVLQPMEWRLQDNQFVAYSLGNFVSGQRKRYTDGGAMVRIELEKVRFNDGSSYTSIDTAGYILQWVYRTADAEKNYYVLPVPETVGHVYSYIKDGDSREAFRTFVSDSRDLFRKHNIGLTELTSPAHYNVRFIATDTLAIRNYLETHSGLRNIDDRLYPTLQIGPMTLPEAMHLQFRLKFDLPVDSLRISVDSLQVK
jgi:poly-gamma-glutamate synthesis protein (capsule biosynthesis protein)